MILTHGGSAVRRLVTAAMLAAVTGGVVRAQAASEVTVAVRGGLQSFDKSASLDNTAMFGLDAMYGINPWLSFGPAMTLARANTTGDHFISMLTYGVINLGDTTTFYEATQPVNVLDGALNLKLHLQGSTFQPYATGGIGGYVLFLDSQVNRGAKSKSGLSFNIGAGVLYPLNDVSGLVLDVRGATFTDYDRTILDPRSLDNRLPQSARVENSIFAELWPAPPENKKTVFNFSVTLGFSYTPQQFGGGN
jgi:outer membrane protein W